jgi:hypothetical protein
MATTVIFNALLNAKRGPVSPSRCGHVPWVPLQVVEGRLTRRLESWGTTRRTASGQFATCKDENISYAFLFWNAKAVPLHAMKAVGGEEYSSCSFSTSALDGSEWQASRPDPALPPGKGPPVPIVQEAGWAPELVWTQRLEEMFFFAPAGDRTSIARPSSP